MNTKHYLEGTSKQVYINKLVKCPDEPEYGCKFNFRFTEKDKIQYMTGEVILPSAWGNDVNVRLEFLASKDGKNYKKFVESNVGVCKTLKIFIGPFADDLFKAAKLMPGSCPVPKGKYAVKNYKMDLRTFFLKETLPIGFVKAIGHAYEKQSKTTLCCFIFDVEVKN